MKLARLIASMCFSIATTPSLAQALAPDTGWHLKDKTGEGDIRLFTPGAVYRF